MRDSLVWRVLSFKVKDMRKCNDCGNITKNGVMIVRGYSYLSGGEYYSGPEICEQCAIKRREQAIANYEEQISTNTPETVR